MIEILLKNNEIRKVKSTDELSNQLPDFHVMQFIDYTPQEINWAEENFGIDFSIMKHYEDIEISSHLLVNKHQVSFHISLPYYNEEKILLEAPVFFIISTSGLFFFSNSEVDIYINKIYSAKIGRAHV